jgi:hypothetical protein
VKIDFRIAIRSRSRQRKFWPPAAQGLGGVPVFVITDID